MLPFLQKKHSVAGTIIAKRKADGGIVEDTESSNDSEGLEACVRDLFAALKADDAKAGASALKAAFEICGSYPEKSEENEQPSEITE